MKPLLRLVDANLNRTSEGLRVVEDVSRFILNDRELFSKLRDLRHNLIQKCAVLGDDLLRQREVEEDVGAEHQSTEVNDLASVVRANFRRVEQSLRVMEEVARTPAFPLPGEAFSQVRFLSYRLEKELWSSLKRKEKKDKLYGLYAILDVSLLEGRDEVEIAQKLIRGGARAVQLRDKLHSPREVLNTAQRLREVCQDVLFIVNDFLDVAEIADADGLHVGQDDISPSACRSLLSTDKILGLSTHSISEVEETKGVDYIAVGSIFASSLKKGKVVGPLFIQQAKKLTSLPLIAIGGIDTTNISQVVECGADAVAVGTAILREADVEKATRRLVEMMEETKIGPSGDKGQDLE
jgi:thiamine-phosphate pyrophosphorylase